eukprot:9508597-Lingulodinium_polyedra.AAC.1
MRHACDGDCHDVGGHDGSPLVLARCCTCYGSGHHAFRAMVITMLVVVAVAMMKVMSMAMTAMSDADRSFLFLPHRLA